MNYVANVMNKNMKDVNTEEVNIIPVNTGVLLHFYDENPYRKIETTNSGLIIGIESTKTYKSDETGELETNDEAICCAKVIAVGPECKNVKVGEDVYIWDNEIITLEDIAKMCWHCGFEYATSYYLQEGKLKL